MKTKHTAFLILIGLIFFSSAKAEIKLLATSLGGCNDTALRAGENPLENDTVIISTVADTLNVFVGRNYICGAPFLADCEIRNDSIFMYITDTCENPSECYDRCECYYTFDFQFAGQGDKNYPYKIVLSDPREDEPATISEGIISAAPPLNIPKVLSLPVSGSELFQNHPNPFKGETTIRYTLPAGVTRAEIQLVDLSGKQLKRQVVDPSGIVAVKSSELEAGVYFYSLVIAGEAVGTKRMIVIK